MMKPIIMQVALFRNDEDHVRSRVSMLWLLNALVQVDRLIIRFCRDIPKIYESGVRYVYKDDVESAAWQDILTCVGKGYGDCKDFAAWRAAELQEQGINARPIIKWRKVDGIWKFHALNEYQDENGEWIEEDPSKVLGMGDHRPFVKTTHNGGSIVANSKYDDGVNGLFENVPVLNLLETAGKAAEGMNQFTPAGIAKKVIRGLMDRDPKTQAKAKEIHRDLINKAKTSVHAATAAKMVNYGAAQCRAMQDNQIAELCDAADQGDEKAAAKIDDIQRKAAGGDKGCIATMDKIRKYRDGGTDDSGDVSGSSGKSGPGDANKRNAPPRGAGSGASYGPSPAPPPQSGRGRSSSSDEDGDPGEYDDGDADVEGAMEESDYGDYEISGDDYQTNGVESIGDMASMFMDIFKSVAPAAGPIASMMASTIPVVGPMLAPLAGDLAKNAAAVLIKANSGDPAAQQKIETIKQGAKAGDPQALESLDALRRVQASQLAIAKVVTVNGMESILGDSFYPKFWNTDFTVRKLYQLGTKAVH